jgi:hypothetical protein
VSFLLVEIHSVSGSADVSMMSAQSPFVAASLLPGRGSLSTTLPIKEGGTSCQWKASDGNLLVLPVDAAVADLELQVISSTFGNWSSGDDVIGTLRINLFEAAGTARITPNCSHCSVTHFLTRGASSTSFAGSHGEMKLGMKEVMPLDTGGDIVFTLHRLKGPHIWCEQPRCHQRRHHCRCHHWVG